MKINKEKLLEVLKNHQLWLDSDERLGAMADLSRVDLRGNDLYEVDLSKANLSEANLSKVNLVGASLIKTNLSGANLSSAQLPRATLYNANLFKANLRDANLIAAHLGGANLNKVNLTGANLTGANLTDTCIVGFYIKKDFGYFYNNTVKILCEEHSLDYWLKNYKQIGKMQGYSKDDIYNYKLQLNLLKKLK